MFFQQWKSGKLGPEATSKSLHWFMTKLPGSYYYLQQETQHSMFCVMCVPMSARRGKFWQGAEFMLHNPREHHQMETFSALLALLAGNLLVTGEFPSQRPVTQSFDVFFDLCLNKWLCKQWRLQWFEMPLHSLWHHCNAVGRQNSTMAKTRSQMRGG